MLDSNYPSALRHTLTKCKLAEDCSVLILCSGDEDVAAVNSVGLTNVVFSNLGAIASQGNTRWENVDAENIFFPDDAFDLVIAHWGLHHCRSPHRAILEMFRVARRGILFIEPKDNLFTHLGVMLGYGQEYELQSVLGNELVRGGVRNTEIPNFVFRFSANEVGKTMKCAYPFLKIQIYAESFLRIPDNAGKTSWVKRNALKMLRPFLLLGGKWLPFLHNQLMIIIPKPATYQPWIRSLNGIPSINRDYFTSH